MKLAIMQPYFAPYIGYWQLMKSVDRFVVYDDVNYIKGGWINRNRILINGKPTYITIPLSNSSPFKHICDTEILPSNFWRKKIIRTIELAYCKAPYFAEVFPIIREIVDFETNNLSKYLVHSIQTLTSYMGITTALVCSSRHYNNCHLTGQIRVLDICVFENASIYINLEGGQPLYDKHTFAGKRIELEFIKTQAAKYKQRHTEFVPNLSIIDLLMHVGPNEIGNHLDSFQLI